MTNEQMLVEVEELLRSSPSDAVLTISFLVNEEALGWLGRTRAVLGKWDSTEDPSVSDLIRTILAEGTLREVDPPGPAYRELKTLLHQARRDLQMKTAGPLTVQIPDGNPFDYFDKIRKVTEMASNDLLFVDPYLDAEFVSRYLPQITSGVTVRLLTSKKLSALLPAVDTFVAQHSLQVQVRSVSSGLHDRHVFVDGTNCYQSGASFKDGAKHSPTTLTQITDAFEAVFKHYQGMWDAAKPERSCVHISGGFARAPSLAIRPLRYPVTVRSGCILNRTRSKQRDMDN